MAALENKILYAGELNLVGMAILCYVLDNGKRVLSGVAMQYSLKVLDNYHRRQGDHFQAMLNRKSMQKFLFDNKDSNHYKPIECWKGKAKINGYEATILVDICDAFLQARKEIKLGNRQMIIAEQCENLMCCFAKVGITVLVDETTGYQEVRDEDVLNKILEQYVVKELMPWTRKFPPEFYNQIFRLNDGNWARILEFAELMR